MTEVSNNITKRYIIIENSEIDDYKDVICYVDTEQEAQEIVKTLNDKYWGSRPRINFYYESIIPWKDIEGYYCC